MAAVVRDDDTHLGAVLARVLPQFAVHDGPMAQQRGSVAVTSRAQITPERILGIVMRQDQMVVQSGRNNYGYK